jgi:hypothetical protein
MAIDQCRRTTSCADCAKSKTATTCVETSGKAGPDAHCVSLPGECVSDHSCTCVGPAVCTGAFSACSQGADPGPIMCGCPTC